MEIEAFSDQGKRALVVGGSSGMGAATARLLAELGADVIVADYAPVPFPVSQFIELDLREPATIDRALEELKAPIHAVFSCAGVAEVPGVMQVNFLGQRHLIEGMMRRDLLPPGSAIAMISSTAGLGWEKELDMLGELLDTASFEEGVAWVDSHSVPSYYALSKKAVAPTLRVRGTHSSSAGCASTRPSRDQLTLLWRARTLNCGLPPAVNTEKPRVSTFPVRRSRPTFWRSCAVPPPVM